MNAIAILMIVLALVFAALGWFSLAVPGLVLAGMALTVAEATQD